VKIYVGNLSFQTTDSELGELFSQHGDVVEATVITDRETGRSRGFGFVEMSDDGAAREAIKELDGTEFGGRQLKVNEARPRNDRGGGGGGGGRRGGGGGGGGRRDRW
jgi:cold-inducible RNA-binding protein